MITSHIELIPIEMLVLKPMLNRSFNSSGFVRTVSLRLLHIIVCCSPAPDFSAHRAEAQVPVTEKVEGVVRKRNYIIDWKVGLGLAILVGMRLGC